MIFVTIWSFPLERRSEANARFKETGGDKPPAGIKLLGRWFAAGDGKGGHVCECDDALALAKWARAWSDLLSIEIYPAIDDEEALKMLA